MESLKRKMHLFQLPNYFIDYQQLTHATLKVNLTLQFKVNQ